MVSTLKKISRHQSHFSKMSSSRACGSCSKTVYIVEELKANNILFHRHCFKCKHCSSTLTLANFAAVNGNFYCKPHYQQLFKSVGGKYALEGKSAQVNEIKEKSRENIDEKQSVKIEVGTSDNQLQNRIENYQKAVSKSNEVLLSSEKLKTKSTEDITVKPQNKAIRSLSVSSSGALVVADTSKSIGSSLSDGIDRRRSIRLKEKLKTPDASTGNIFSEAPIELHNISSNSNKNINQTLKSVISEEDQSKNTSLLTSRKASSKQLDDPEEKTQSLKKIKKSSSGLSLHDIAPKETIKVEQVLQPLRDRMAALERSSSIKQTPKEIEKVDKIESKPVVTTSLKDRMNAYQSNLGATEVKPVSRATSKKSNLKDRMNNYQQSLGKQEDKSSATKIEVPDIKSRMNQYQNQLKKFEENKGDKFIEKENKVTSPAVENRKDEFQKSLVKDMTVEIPKKEIKVEIKSAEQKQEIATMVEKVVKKTIKIRNGESVVEDEPKIEIIKVDDRPTNVNISKRMNIWEDRITQSN